MPKTLIYFVSCGCDEYIQQTRRAIKAVRVYGKYHGDIGVITDNTAAFKDLAVLVSDVAPLRAQMADSCPMGAFACNLKPTIIEQFNSFLYDFVLYMDSDTLVVSPKFSSLVNAMTVLGGLWVQPNWFMPICTPGNPSTGSGLITEEEKQRDTSLSICAGLVGFHQNTRCIIEEWLRLSRLYGMRADDQGLLHKVCVNFNNERVHYFNKEDVWFPTNRVRNPIVYHFTAREVQEYNNIVELLNI